MNALLDPCDPEQVVELLELKRSSLIMQYDCALRYAVRDIFLANGNEEAFRVCHFYFNLVQVQFGEISYTDITTQLYLFQDCR